MLKIGTKVVFTESCDNGISVGKVGEIVDTWAGQYLVGFYEELPKTNETLFYHKLYTNTAIQSTWYIPAHCVKSSLSKNKFV